MNQVPIYRSRRAMTVFVDALVALLMLWGGQYLSPEMVKTLGQTWAILQAPVVVMIAAWTVDDAQMVKAGVIKTKQGLRLINPGNIERPPADKPK